MNNYDVVHRVGWIAVRWCVTVLAVALTSRAATPTNFVCADASILEPDRMTALNAFGAAMAMDGDVLVVGEPTIFTAGTVEVFRRSGMEWEREAILVPSDPRADMKFGSAVDVHGDTIVVGAWDADDLTGRLQGAAYVFERNPAMGWTQVAILRSSAHVSFRFGASVAIHGDTIAVRATGLISPPGGGSTLVQVFRRSASGWTPGPFLVVPVALSASDVGRTLDATDGAIIFGDSGVSLPGIPFSGLAFVHRERAGTWELEAMLVPDDPSPAAGYGYAVAIEGDVAVVGARSHDHAGLGQTGAAYVFRRSAGSWTQSQELHEPVAMAAAFLGYDVRLSGDLVIALAPHSWLGTERVHVFRDDGSGFVHAGQVEPLVPSPTGTGFGYRLAVHEGWVAAAYGRVDADRRGEVQVSRCFLNHAPECETAGELTVGCPGVDLVARASDPDGHQLVTTWSASCPDARFVPAASVLEPRFELPDACGRACELTLLVEDGYGGRCERSVAARLDDVTAPRLIANHDHDDACLWPPRHDTTCLRHSDLRSVVLDECGEASDWAIVGCLSSKPDDGRGDGHTLDDCVVAADGESACVRRERDGSGTGRTYAILGAARDRCGNVGVPTVVAHVHVPHSAGDKAARCERER